MSLYRETKYLENISRIYFTINSIINEIESTILLRNVD